MLAQRIRTARDTASWRLCLGCGACAYICPERKVELVDVVDEGIRPIVLDESCGNCRLCLRVCPAYENDHRPLRRRPGIEAAVYKDFGPVLEIWEGYARDRDVRHRGASGGAITALALYCLEREHVHGVLHLQGDPDDPIRNRTYFSRSGQELLAATGSRYAPGSVCDGLERIESAPARCVFVGQPCEVTALRKAQLLRPALDDRVGLVVSFFCAGSPATRGTIELLREQGIDTSQIEEVRYRGLGWPGMFAVRMRGETAFRPLTPYQQTWGALQRFRPYSVHLFPDLSGEDADISCADAWNRQNEESDGYSLLVVRTERGREALRAARESGYLEAERVDAARLLQAQRSLVGNRGVFWGRVLAFRLLGLPVPKLRGFGGAADWWRLTASDKVKSTLGTARRVIQREYHRPLHFQQHACVHRTSKAQRGHAGDCASFRTFQGTGSQRLLKTHPADPNEPFRVGLMGAPLNTGNRGVSALGASLVRLIRQNRPDATILFLVGARNPGHMPVYADGLSKSVTTINYRLSPRAAIGQQLLWILPMSLAYRLTPSARARRWIARTSPWIRTVAQADFVGDIRGGDSFSDTYGAKEFLVGSLPVLSVIWIRGHIHLLPQTYGPFRSRLARRLARYILLRAESIWCRDRASLQEVARLTKRRRRGSLCPDVAFALEAVRPKSPTFEPDIPANDGLTLVGLNVNGLVYRGGYTRANMFGLRLDYCTFVKRLVEQLLSDPSNRILLVPHTFAPEGRVESDPAACRDLVRRLAPSLRNRVHLVATQYDQHQIKGIIGMCDFFIGSRMHACIAALSQGIPTIGVAYSRKFAGVFDVVGVADWVIDGRSESEDDALKRAADLFSEREPNGRRLAALVGTAQDELSRAFAQIVGATTPADAGVCYQVSSQ